MRSALKADAAIENLGQLNPSIFRLVRNKVFYNAASTNTYFYIQEVITELTPTRIEYAEVRFSMRDLL